MKERTETIEDFSGGWRNFDDANRIDNKESPTQLNTYYANRSLTKRGGNTASALTTPTIGATTVGFRGFALFNSVFNNVEYLFIAGTDASSTFVTVQYLTGGLLAAQISYAAGTVTTTSGSAIVTGVGTSWSTQIIGSNVGGTPGDMFKANADGNYVNIASVDSDTQLTLTTAYPSSNIAGSAYTIIPRWPYNIGSQTARGRIRFVSLNKTLYIVSSYSNLTKVRSFDLTTLGFVNAFPAAKYVVQYKNYVFGGNTSANPTRVAWSALKDATTWPASNFIDINPDDGQEIRGMFLDGQSIVVLKRKSAYKITGDIFDPTNPSYTFTPIYVPSDFYIDCDRVVQLYRGSFIMRGAFGLYQYFGGNVIEKHNASTKTNSEWAALNTVAFGGNDSAYREGTSIVYKNRYWVTGYQATGPAQGTEIMVLDDKDALWKFDPSNQGATGTSWSDFAFHNGSFFAVDSFNPSLMQMDTGSSDNGSTGTTNINGTWTSKVFQFANQQHFMNAAIFFKKQAAGSLTFSYSIDEGAFTDVTVDMTTGTGTRTKSTLITIGQVGYAIQFKVANNVAAQGFSVYAIQYYRRDLEV